MFQRVVLQLRLLSCVAVPTLVSERACETSKIPYCGVVENVELRGTQMSVSQFISSKKSEGHWIHMHVSTPCSSGSPLKRFSPDSVTASDLEWETIMTSVPAYFRFPVKPDSVSFELPKHNDIWKRDQTIKALSEGELVFDQDVYLCQAQYRASNGLPIGKVLRFVSNHKPFCDSLFSRFGVVCTCREHASLSDVTWSDTGYYNPTLSRAILNAAKACMRKSKPGRSSWRDGSLGVSKGGREKCFCFACLLKGHFCLSLIFCGFQVFGLMESGRHAEVFLWNVENIVTCDVGAEALVGFDLSVVHLALSGSVVGGLARFCNKMNLKRIANTFTPGGRICNVSWESGISFALLGVVFLFAFKSQL